MVAFTDIHSHVLHGVDDGSADESVAVATLKQMKELGVDSLILTPHYCKRRGYETPVEDIKAAYGALCDACKRENIGIALYLGTELEYSTDTVRYIREGRVLTLAGSKYILVEFAPYAGTDTMLKGCREIMQLGLIPVVAHVERYESVCSNPGVIGTLREMGVKIQVNIRSVCAAGFRLRRFLKHIFSESLVDFLAGDVHSLPLEKRELDRCIRFVLKYSSREYLEKLLNGNAKNIINGGQI